MEYVYDRERFDNALYNVFSKYAKTVSIDFSADKVFSSDELEAAGFLPHEFSTQQKLEAARIFNDCARGGQSFEEFVKYMEFFRKGIKTRDFESFAQILSEEILNKPRKFEGEVSFEDICEFFEDKHISSVYKPLLKKINKQAKLASKGKLDAEKAISPDAFLRLVSSACNVNNAFEKTEKGDKLFQAGQAHGVFAYNNHTNSYLDANITSNLLEMGYTEQDIAKIDKDIFDCAERHDMRLGRRKDTDRISLRERFSTYRNKDFQINFIPSNAIAYDNLTQVFRSNLLSPYALEEISPDLHQEIQAKLPVFSQSADNSHDNDVSGLTEENILRAKDYGKTIGQVAYGFSKIKGIEADNIAVAKAVSDTFANRGGYVMDKFEGLTTLAEVALSDEVVKTLPYSDKMFRAYAPNVDQNDVMQVYDFDLLLPQNERRYVGSGFVKNNGILFPVDNLPVSPKANASKNDNIQYELNLKDNLQDLKVQWEKKFHTSFDLVEEQDIHFGKNPLATAFVERANAQYIEENKPNLENFDDIKQAMKEQYEANVGMQPQPKPKAEVVPAEQEKPLKRKPYACKDTLSMQQAYEVLIGALVMAIENFKEGNVSETMNFDEIERQARLSRKRKSSTATKKSSTSAKTAAKESSEKSNEQSAEEANKVVEGIKKETAEKVAKTETKEEIKSTSEKTTRRKQTRGKKAMTEEQRMAPDLLEILACRSVEQLIVDAETDGLLSRDEVAEFSKEISDDKNKNKILLKRIKALVSARYMGEDAKLDKTPATEQDEQVISEITEEVKQEIKSTSTKESSTNEQVEQTTQEISSALDLSDVKAPSQPKPSEYTISDEQAEDMIVLADSRIPSAEATYKIKGIDDDKVMETSKQATEQKAEKKPTAKERFEAEQEEIVKKAAKKAKRTAAREAAKRPQPAPQQDDKFSTGMIRFNGELVKVSELNDPNNDWEEVVSFDDDDDLTPSK